MRTPALAIAWELWGKSRVGIAVLGAALLVLAVAGSGLPKGPASEPIFPLSVILFALACLYLASQVMHCEYREGALVSGYPSRMFTLPVSSHTLVAWPMVFGASSLALLWCAMAMLIWLPAGAEPAWWLLPLLVVALAWLQAVFWAVPGSSLMKILAACVVFPALKATLELIAICVALFVDPHSPLDRAAFVDSRAIIITLFCSCFLPLAYVVAVAGIALDRRGSRVEGRWIAGLIERAMQLLPERRIPFSSATQAQFWIEWRCKGFLLPLFPACFLLFVTVVVVPFVSARQLWPLLAFLCAAVPVVAFFVGYGLGKTGFWADDLGLSSWQATRPLSSDGLAAAKLQTAALSALTTVGMLVVGIPAWLAAVGKFQETFQLWQPYLRQFSAMEVGAIALVGVSGLWVMTWGQMVGGLVLSLTGRAWVVNAGVAYHLLLLTALGFAARWVGAHSTDLELFWSVLTGCLCGLAGIKLLVLGGILHTLRRQNLWNARRLGFAVGLWSLGAGCLVTLTTWVWSTGGLLHSGFVGRSIDHMPVGLVAFASVLALPLVRPIAAPLAVAWNRHR